ncbi:hypothetical protein H4R19_002748 [Coemansia spiralis]|nr:hypothetical protein H4R19_002748 [Coemansia spiralis]
MLPSTGRIHAVEILELCARNIASRIFALDRPAFQLAQFAGSFAAADWNHTLMAPAVAALRDVFGHLLSEDVAWIVRHQAHLQLVRIATESADQSIAEALVPESRQASLVQFIQRVPSGTEMASADERASVYQSVFASLCWHAPGVDGVRANGRANGHANGKQEVVPGHVPALLDAIGVLRQRLEVAARTPMPPGASEAIRVELAQLAREIEHFQ